MCGEYSEQKVICYAAATESKQSHLIAKAIIQQAIEQQLELPEIKEVACKLGYGLTFGIEGRVVRVGSVRFLEQERIVIFN